MKKLVLLILAGFMAFSAMSYAGPRPEMTNRNSTIDGGNQFNKDFGDAIDQMGPTGSDVAYIGDFESGWSGRTSINPTKGATARWSVSAYNQAVVGNYAAWCGDISIAACSPTDMVGGYGNNWVEMLSCRATVENPGISALVTVTATLQYDTEPGYDFVFLSARVNGSSSYTNLQSWGGQGTAAVNNSYTYLPGEYIDDNDVYMLWRFTSDGSYSDEDCLLPTAGALQVDDITVTISQAGEADIVSFTDFQPPAMSFGHWFIDCLGQVDSPEIGRAHV